MAQRFQQRLLRKGLGSCFHAATIAIRHRAPGASTAQALVGCTGLVASFAMLSRSQPTSSLCEKQEDPIIFNSKLEPYKIFSNEHIHETAYRYVIPCGAFKGEVLYCKHSNKALHCTKASVFGDRDNFDEIAAEVDAVKCQQLGRKCKNFDQRAWDQHVHDVAFEVVVQKFRSDPVLANVLLGTGDTLIGEATANALWGTGFTPDHEDARKPDRWTGQNIQGQALMRARRALRQGQQQEGVVDLTALLIVGFFLMAASLRRPY